MQTNQNGNSDMNTRNGDPIPPPVIGRLISPQWLAGISATIVLSIFTNGVLFFLTTRENQIRAENNIERQREYNARFELNFTQLSSKLDNIVTEGTAKRVLDDRQTTQIENLTLRITAMETRNNDNRNKR